MGFRKDGFATVWDVKPQSSTMTTGRISVSHKDKNTNEYVQDWGGFVAFIGTACADKASRLKPQDRIKLGDVDVTNRYDSESGIEYTNFLIYSFELPDKTEGSGVRRAAKPSASVDNGRPSDNLPF